MPYPAMPPSLLLTVASLEQWNQTVIKSGLETMEIVKEIETSEFLRRWRWYASALQQHMYATLMLIEVFAFPGADYAMRAWESMDWVFQVPPCVPHNHKARWVMEGAVRVLKEYLKARKLRCPTTMDERLGIAPYSPLRPKSRKLRKINARPTKTATTARSRGKRTSRSDDPGTPASTSLLNRALSQSQVTSDVGASPQDMETTTGPPAMFTGGLTHKNPDPVHTSPVCR